MRKGTFPPMCFTPSQWELEVESLLLYTTGPLETRVLLSDETGEGFDL